LFVDMQKHGAKTFKNLPQKNIKQLITDDEMALIDELSGLTAIIDDFMIMSGAPQHVKERIGTYVMRLDPSKDREAVKFDLHKKFYGDQR
jgi:hypothetical protein